MELIIVTLISLMLIVSAVITSMLSSKMKTHLHYDKIFEYNKQSTNNSYGYDLISSGYAYTIDTGDSMVIVVVMDKRNSFNSFMSSQPIPIKVLGIDTTD
ncbi:MAG: hypothetical protein QXL96_00035 [Ignisphaera sp.]